MTLQVSDAYKASREIRGPMRGCEGGKEKGVADENPRAWQGSDTRPDWGDFGYGQGGYGGRGYDSSDQGSGYGREGYHSAPVWTSGRPWEVPGPHTGRGPRGYRRSDERIGEEICDRLTRHGQIDATDVDVGVNQGEVVLTGTVDSRQVKWMIEDVAASVLGVKDVTNRLRVAHLPPGREVFGSGVEPAQLQQGMDVVGSDGNVIGRVKEVRRTDFLVDRRLSRDVYVPLDAIRSVEGQRITLRIPANQVDSMGWAIAAVVGSPAPTEMLMPGDNGQTGNPPAYPEGGQPS